MQDIQNNQLIIHRLDEQESKLNDIEHWINGNGTTGIKQQIALMQNDLSVVKKVAWLIFSTVAVLLLTAVITLVLK